MTLSLLTDERGAPDAMVMIDRQAGVQKGSGRPAAGHPAGPRPHDGAGPDGSPPASRPRNGRPRAS
jgi:hypothetical protein